jgi:predicted esterase
MKIKHIMLFALLYSAVVLGNTGSLIIDTIEPAASNSPISSASYDTNISGASDVGNGQSFITTNAFDLAQITLVKGSDQDYQAGSVLRLTLFAWNPAHDANDISEWAKGDGIDDDDPLNGTGMTLLFSEDFDVPYGGIDTGDYIHFNLGTNIALSANTAYGFTSEFIYGLAGGSQNINYKLERGFGGDVFAGGTFIATTTTANNNTANRNLAFYLSDVGAEAAEPPPDSVGSLAINNIWPIGGSALIKNSQNNTSQGQAVSNAVGQSFITTSAFDLRTISLIKGPATIYKVGNKLRLNIFSWNPTTDANDVVQWKLGDGLGDGDLLNNTGMTLLYSEFFDLPDGLIDIGSFLHFALNTNIALAANTTYAFTTDFIYGGNGGATTFNYMKFNADAYEDGQQIGATASTNNNVLSADMAFYMGDTVVSSVIDATLISEEDMGDGTTKLTVSTLYPEFFYPLTKFDPGSADAWLEAAHSTNGLPPFIVTNITYSATDVTGTNYVVYVQSNGTQIFTIGSEAIGNFEQRVYTNGANTLPYRMLKPDSYDPNVKYPLVIGFHGAGGTGTDNISRSIEAMVHLSARDVRRDHPAFVITPQAPVATKWADTPWQDGSYSISEVPVTVAMTLVYEIIDALILEYNIDTDRIYATGQSMGAFGAWDCVMRQPERFAALVPMAGGGDPTQAPNLLKVGIWNFHGADDAIVPTSASQEMDAALIAAGHANYIYSEYPGVGHAVTGPAWAEENLIPWIFQQKRTLAGTLIIFR